MRRFSVVLIAVLAMSVSVAAVTASGADKSATAAKNRSVTLKISGKLNDKTLAITGTGSGSYGKATVTGKATPPKLAFKFKVKGGTVKISATVDVTFNGTWKFTGGTGKYKGIKGSGKVTGKSPVPLTANFTFKGKSNK